MEDFTLNIRLGHHGHIWVKLTMRLTNHISLKAVYRHGLAGVVSESVCGQVKLFLQAVSVLM